MRWPNCPARRSPFEWTHGGLLVDEVCLILEDRHPQKVAEAERAFEEWKTRRRTRKD
jgi:hypothetical protein